MDYVFDIINLAKQRLLCNTFEIDITSETAIGEIY